MGARKRMAFALGWFSFVYILGAIFHDSSDEVRVTTPINERGHVYDVPRSRVRRSGATRVGTIVFAVSIFQCS